MTKKRLPDGRTLNMETGETTMEAKSDMLNYIILLLIVVALVGLTIGTYYFMTLL